jgi:phage shock protein E
MKKIIIIISAVIVLSLVGIVIVSNKPKEITQVEQQEAVLSAQIKKVDGQIIDVREPSEYLSGHADNAINVPLGNILNGDFSLISTTQPIYVYCRTGNRAGQAKVALDKAGYKNVTNIGGLTNWQNQGGKVCSSSASSCG